MKTNKAIDTTYINKKYINAICYISLLFLGIYLAVYQIVINLISEELSIGGAASGMLISLHFAGIMAAPAIFGEISDRIGKRPVIIISFVVMINGFLLVYFSNVLGFIALGIFLIGCGSGVIESVMSGLLADINNGKINQVINISQMYFSIGAVLGPVFALWIADVFGGWKQNYIVLAVLFFIMLVVILSQKRIKLIDNKIVKDKIIENKITNNKKVVDVVIDNKTIYDKELVSENKELSMEKELETASSQKGSIIVFLLREKTVIMLCVSIFIYVGMEEAAAFWTNSYFLSAFNMEKFGAYALSGYWGSMILGRYIGSKFEDKIGIFYSGGLFISFVSIILALIIKNPVLNLVCFVLVGFGFSVVWPYLMATAAMDYYEYTGTAMGVMTMFGSAGGIVIPFLMGALSEMWGISVAFLTVPILILIILLLQKRITRLRFSNY